MTTSQNPYIILTTYHLEFFSTTSSISALCNVVDNMYAYVVSLCDALSDNFVGDGKHPYLLALRSYKKGRDSCDQGLCSWGVFDLTHLRRHLNYYLTS